MKAVQTRNVARLAFHLATRSVCSFVRTRRAADDGVVRAREKDPRAEIEGAA